MIFAGIIWNPAYQFKDEMNSIFNKYSKVLHSVELDLKDDYIPFVYDIYNEEDTAKWKIDTKVEHMKEVKDKKVKVVFFEIDTSTQFYHEFKKCYVFTNVENMKKEVRDTYKNKIDNYFFDIIFHLTDNEKELNYTVNIVDKYLKKVISRDNLEVADYYKLLQFYKENNIVLNKNLLNSNQTESNNINNELDY